MDVLDHQAGGWFLLRHGSDYYLDVHVTLPMVETSLLLALDVDEREEYRALGRVFVEYLAAKVNHWSSRYQSRAIGDPLAEAATSAIVDWRQSHVDT